MVARNKQNFTFISFNAGTVKEYTVRERSHITSSAEGGGGFQKMTLDDGGGGEGGFMVR